MFTLLKWLILLPMIGAVIFSYLLWSKLDTKDRATFKQCIIQTIHAAEKQGFGESIIGKAINDSIVKELKVN